MLHEVDIEIEPGEVVALIGSSGSGKSPLLLLIAGLDRPTDGWIEIDGEPVRGVDPDWANSPALPSASLSIEWCGAAASGEVWVRGRLASGSRTGWRCAMLEE